MYNCILRLGVFTTVVRMKVPPYKINMIDPTVDVIQIHFNDEIKTPDNIKTQVISFERGRQINEDTFLYEYRG